MPWCYICVCALWANHAEKFTLHLKQWGQCGERAQDKFMMIDRRIWQGFEDIIRICASLIEFQIEEWVDWMEEGLETSIKPMENSEDQISYQWKEDASQH